MRAACLLIAILGATHPAVAGERRCYAGTETYHDADAVTTHAVVVVRELDPRAGEIRQTTWTDTDSERESAVVHRVDPKAGTFTLDMQTMHGTGTLDGPAWRWTGYHITIDRSGTTITTDADLRGDTFALTTRISRSGQAGPTFRWVAKAFDCKELVRRRAALSPLASPTAVRTCYAGTATASDGASRGAVLVQTVDRTRIELRERIGPAPHDRVHTLTVKGATALVDGLTPATLTGTPGAWTGYAWRDTSAAMTIAIKGTLGGPQVTHELKITGAGKTSTMTIDATRFDCRDLDARRAALR